MKIFEKILDKYAEFVVNKTWIVLFLGIAFTLFLLPYLGNVKTKSMSYENMLPKNVEEISALFKLENEFSSSSSTLFVLVKAKDVFDPEVIEYIDKLEKNIETLPYVESGNSIADFIKLRNYGKLPKKKNDILEIVSNSEMLSNYISEDRSYLLISFSLPPLTDDQSLELEKEVKEILEKIPLPQGVSAEAGGSVIYRAQLKEDVPKIMGKTSMLSMIMILIIV